MTGIPKLKVQYEGKITLGNIVSALVIVFAVAGVYANMQNRQDQMERVISEMRLNVVENKTFADERALIVDNRVRVLEVSNASMAADLRNIQSGVNDVKATLTQLVNR